MSLARRLQSPPKTKNSCLSSPKSSCAYLEGPSNPCLWSPPKKRQRPQTLLPSHIQYAPASAIAPMRTPTPLRCTAAALRLTLTMLHEHICHLRLPPKCCLGTSESVHTTKTSQTEKTRSKTPATLLGRRFARNQEGLTAEAEKPVVED